MTWGTAHCRARARGFYRPGSGDRDVAGAGSNPRVLSRRARLHFDRCRDARTDWDDRHPTSVQGDLFWIFRVYDRLSLGPELLCLAQSADRLAIALALVIGACGLIVILAFAHVLQLGPGTVAGLGAGSLTQTSMMGTAAGAVPACPDTVDEAAPRAPAPARSSRQNG
jgi:hypothetical protein